AFGNVFRSRLGEWPVRPDQNQRRKNQRAGVVAQPPGDPAGEKWLRSANVAKRQREYADGGADRRCGKGGEESVFNNVIGVVKRSSPARKAIDKNGPNDGFKSIPERNRRAGPHGGRPIRAVLERGIQIDGKRPKANPRPKLSPKQQNPRQRQPRRRPH